MAAYTKALEHKTDYAGAYSNLGAALREQGKVEEAVVACSKRWSSIQGTSPLPGRFTRSLLFRISVVGRGFAGQSLPEGNGAGLPELAL